jgi:hypothetical protein
VKKASLRFWFPLVISNHFYLTSLVNYKLLFISGLFFLRRRLKLRVGIFILTVLICQILSISFYGKNIQDDIVLLLATTAMSFGLFGWAAEGFRRGMALVSPNILLILSIISLVAPSRTLYMSLDPLILFLLYQCSLEQRGSDMKLSPFFIYILFSVVISWRAATLGLLVGFFYSVVYQAKPLLRALYIMILVVCIWAIYEYFITDIFDILLLTGTAGDPTSGRLAMYVDAYQIFIAGLVSLDWGAFFGYGFNSPASLFDDTLSVTVNILGVEVESVKLAVGKDRLHMHNLFLQTLFEFGVVGLAFYLYTLWKFYSHSRKFAIFTVVGVTSGFLSGTMYLYSSYYVILAALYFHERSHSIHDARYLKLGLR